MIDIAPYAGPVFVTIADATVYYGATLNVLRVGRMDGRERGAGAHQPLVAAPGASRHRCRVRELEPRLGE